MPGTVLTYTASEALHDIEELLDQQSILVDIGEMSMMMPPDGGVLCLLLRRAGKHISDLTMGKQTYFGLPGQSLRTDLKFCLSNWSKSSYFPSNMVTAVSSAGAICFVSDYCTLHGVVDQSHAALAAVLFLPLLHSTRKEVSRP